MPDITLNADQQRALSEIIAARKPGGRYVLTGYAGVGKSYLMVEVARAFLKKHLSVVLTAPTHKAVAVLATKIAKADLDVRCCTIHSLLSLKPKPHGDRMVFTRDKRAQPVDADVVVIDECSMVGTDLYTQIRRHLPMAFVLFVGDPAQLPPVEEAESQTFSTKSRSHLETIVRQGAGNPVLDAAQAIRATQGGPMCWEWCKPARAAPLGVYLPGAAADAWMKKAFTSSEFEEDPDKFRYLAWTNARVAEVNRKVRRWRYGENLPTPFMPGERALLRAPVMADGDVQFNTNEEATVLEIARAIFRYDIAACPDAEGWTAELPSWRIMLERGDGEQIPVHMPADDGLFNRVVDRIKDEAFDARDRWQHLHDFKSSLARLQSIYALTVHNSQGSTFGSTFVDVRDIRRRESSNLLEMQQLLYVAATRPSQALMLLT